MIHMTFTFWSKSDRDDTEMMYSNSLRDADQSEMYRWRYADGGLQTDTHRRTHPVQQCGVGAVVVFSSHAAPILSSCGRCHHAVCSCSLNSVAHMSLRSLMSDWRCEGLDGVSLDVSRLRHHLYGPELRKAPDSCFWLLVRLQIYMVCSSEVRFTEVSFIYTVIMNQIINALFCWLVLFVLHVQQLPCLQSLSSNWEVIEGEV